MDQQTGSPIDADHAGVFADQNKMTLEAILPDYLRGQRWFSAKARDIARVRITEEIPFSTGAAGPPRARLTFIEVQYAEGEPQTFVLPLAFATGADAARLQQR